jgi:hypothetical protein
MALRHDSTSVVIDTLTKSSHFIPVRTTYQAPDIARVFISEIVRLHGMPKKIISDRGSVVTGQVSKRPWEPNLILVLRITQRLIDRQNVQTKPWKTYCACTSWTSKNVGRKSCL